MRIFPRSSVLFLLIPCAAMQRQGSDAIKQNVQGPLTNDGVHHRTEGNTRKSLVH